MNLSEQYAALVQARIDKLISRRGPLTQQQIADLLDIPQPRLNEILRARKRMPFTYSHCLLLALDALIYEREISVAKSK